MLLSKDPYKTDLKYILHLVEILLVLPISAAGCERMVSAQNRIKSSLRASLKTQTLEGLNRISAQGPPLDNFNPAPSVNRWFARDRCKKIVKDAKDSGKLFLHLKVNIITPLISSFKS